MSDGKPLISPGARREAARERRAYLLGFFLAVTLTLAAFAVASWGGLGRAASIGAIAGLAMMQVVVQLRLFLHIDLSASKREDLQLILFTSLIVLLMVGGSLLILSNLQERMGGT